MNFHEIIFMAIAILGIQAGVYRRPIVTPPSLSGTYFLTLQVVKDQQPIAPSFEMKDKRDRK